MDLRRYLLPLIALSGTALAAEVDNATVLGVNPRLSDGARALEFRNFDDGVRLTRDGLRGETSSRNRAAGFSNLCAGYAGLGRFAEALAACDEALAIRAGNWRVFNNRAIANLGLGRLAAAREDVDRGLALNPDSPTLLKVLAMVEARGRDGSVTLAGRGDPPPGGPSAP